MALMKDAGVYDVHAFVLRSTGEVLCGSDAQVWNYELCRHDGAVHFQEG